MTSLCNYGVGIYVGSMTVYVSSICHRTGLTVELSHRSICSILYEVSSFTLFFIDTILQMVLLSFLSCGGPTFTGKKRTDELDS